MNPSYLTSCNTVQKEYDHAVRKHGPFNSSHEGYAVILEELDELWDEIKKQKPDKVRMYCEAAQIAAVAIRFMVDCCKEEE